MSYTIYIAFYTRSPCFSRSYAGKIDRAVFGVHSMPDTVPYLRTVMPVDNTAFTVLNSSTGWDTYPVQKRRFEVADAAWRVLVLRTTVEAI